MKAAQLINGELIYITHDLAALQKEQPTLFCPKCHRPVRICVKKDGSYYFRHIKRGRVNLQAGETIQHLNGKMRLYQWLKPHYPNCRLEVSVKEQTQRSDLLLQHQQQKLALEYQCSLISAQELSERTYGYESINMKTIWIFGERFYRMKRLSDSFEFALRYSRQWGNFLVFLLEDELVIKYQITFQAKSRNMNYKELRLPLKKWHAERFVEYWLNHTQEGANLINPFELQRQSNALSYRDAKRNNTMRYHNIQEVAENHYPSIKNQWFTTQDMARIRIGTEQENRQFLAVLYQMNCQLEELPRVCFSYPRYTFAWHTPAYIWKGYLYQWLNRKKNIESLKIPDIMRFMDNLAEKQYIRPSNLRNQREVAEYELQQFLDELGIGG